MTTSQFRITYDGPALSSGEMEIRELAPALYAIGDLFEQANRVLNGTEVKVSVNVRGSFKTGSFGIDLVAAQGWADSFVKLFNSQPIVASATFLSILGFSLKEGFNGLLKLIKWIKNRPITKVEIKENIAIIFVEGQSIEVEIEVLKLLQDYKVRKALEGVVYAPLQKEGVDTFAVGPDEKQISETIDKKEALLFVAPSLADEPVEDVAYDATVQIARIEFGADENKWRFTDGETSFFAPIIDQEYLQKINQFEAIFSKGDILKVKVRKKQWLTMTGLKAEYFIEKVLSHRSAARQIKLPGTEHL
jgi:hypothetical protein